ncbi:auxin-induced protein 6B-like [Pyrus ussuriensis x Pyrus communis]|uniref:Auxin-induced protein 6B-like n=1 Tax=Pyrus ussuriensis x Pyrus communis TaxID=2448454 RepID=A0A5N5GAG7_9ROSA|nr:auxin-induced protein 6B-like [Pyrus ussuriensis x Pyrus communis]
MHVILVLLEDFEQLIKGVGRTCNLQWPANLRIEHIRLDTSEELDISFVLLPRTRVHNLSWASRTCLKLYSFCWSTGTCSTS